MAPVPITQQTESVEQKFRRLATVWRAETEHLSSTTMLFNHPAYQDIISLGPDVVPSLLRDLEKEPDHWPPGVSNEERVAAFVAAFATLGYAPCTGEELEQGYEKVALYATADGITRHAARQLADGRWTRKLGRGVDIEHALHAIECPD